MRAYVVTGRITDIDSDSKKITIEGTDNDGPWATEYTLDFEIKDKWVLDNIGEVVDLVIVDDKVKSVRYPQLEEQN
jgi:Cu/Ag efflux protein CusF